MVFSEMLAGNGHIRPTPLSKYVPPPKMGELQPAASAKPRGPALGRLAPGLAADPEPQLTPFQWLEDSSRRHPAQEEGLRLEYQPLVGLRTGYTPGRVTGPVQFLARLLDLWQLDFSDACSLLGFEHGDSESVKQLFSGVASLRGRDRKDRIAILIRIRTLLAGLFQDINVENAWLREQNPDLNGRTPLQLLREGSMENLLTLRDLVERAAGL